MADQAPRVRAIVLAAGAGSRFGGRKLEARIAGRPLLQHVLDALAAAGHDDPIVVLAPDSGLEPVIAWRRAHARREPGPERGASASSLQLGWAAAMAADPPPDAVLVALGDQPRLAPEVIRALVAAPLDPARPIVAPRYSARTRATPSGSRRARPATALVDAATGDRGLGPLLEAQPDSSAGSTSPATTRTSIGARTSSPRSRPTGRTACGATASRSSGCARRTEDEDHYAPVADLFRDDPRRSGDAILDAAAPTRAKPDDTWLDVGAGGGRYAFPLALAVREVIALDPSPAMVAALEDGVRAHDLANVRVVAGRWPDAARRSRRCRARTWP